MEKQKFIKVEHVSQCHAAGRQQHQIDGTCYLNQVVPGNYCPLHCITAVSQCFSVKTKVYVRPHSKPFSALITETSMKTLEGLAKIPCPKAGKSSHF